ncbi:MAG TPA: ABC transporter [Clostridiales bacterium]|nr:ABC transporter [Clostridiales bacterium]
MLAIFKREIRAYFVSPIGYVVIVLFLLFSGYFFSFQYSLGSPDLSFVFSQMFSIVLFVIPILTMRLMSEDKRLKVDQALLTAPIRLSSIVLGKFFAAMVVFLIGFSGTLVFQLIISAYVSPNWIVYFGNLLGILLLGSALISIGIFVSSLTESQMVAAVASFAISLFVMLLDTFAEIINISIVKKIADWVSFLGRYEAFTNGIFDYSNVVFFLSFAAVFLFLTVRMLEKKRWA